MALFRKKTDPISERARALNEQIAALEAQIKQLSAPPSQPSAAPPTIPTSPAPRLRSTAVPHGHPAAPNPFAGGVSPEPIFEGYNVKLLAPGQEPTSYAELYSKVQQDPSRYKLVSYPPTNPLAYAAVYGLIHILGADTVWKYFDVYAPHTKTFSEGLSGLQFLVQGGASVGYLSSGLSQGVLKGFKGIADATFMSDATPLIPRAKRLSLIAL